MTEEGLPILEWNISTSGFDRVSSELIAFLIECLMAYCLNFTSPSILTLGMNSARKVTDMRCRVLTSTSKSRYFTIRAVQENEGPRRLVDIIRIVPEISRNYFRSPSRRALFGGISLLGGFYVAQTISLSFGALGVNDVIAAVLCVLLTEYVTRFYYSQPKRVDVALTLDV